MHKDMIVFDLDALAIIMFLQQLIKHYMKNQW